MDYRRLLLPGGPSSSEGSTVGPMVLSLAIFNNLVLTMSSQTGKTLAKRRMQKLENLHYYVLSTLFPLPVHLDDQCSEFLESWMAYLEFNKFPDLIKYYTTIGNGTLLKEKHTTIKVCTLLKDIKQFMYLTQSYFSDNTPNQLLHIMSTLLSWLKNFCTTIGQYPTLYDFLAIAPKDITCLNWYLMCPNQCAKQKIFQPTLLPPPVYSGEVSHHMCDSGKSNDSSVCHTIKMTSPSIFVEFWGLPPLILFFNTSIGWFGRFALSTECYRTRKLGYKNLNWPRCSARVTESLALTDGGFCQKQTLYISDYVKLVSL